MTDRLEVSRTIPADASAIFAVLRDPHGHLAIDSSGMIMAASGTPVSAAGDRFDLQMHREALNDLPLGRYDVTVIIASYEQDREISWTVDSPLIDVPINHFYGYSLRPVEDGTEVTSWYDWSQIDDVWRNREFPGMGTVTWPVIPEATLRATLGILERTVVNKA
ncbi:MAG: polyketide cyclase [Sporichthyaceae bacterium]